MDEHGNDFIHPLRIGAQLVPLARHVPKTSLPDYNCALSNATTRMNDRMNSGKLELVVFPHLGISRISTNLHAKSNN